MGNRLPGGYQALTKTIGLVVGLEVSIAGLSGQFGFLTPGYMQHLYEQGRQLRVVDRTITVVGIIGEAFRDHQPTVRNDQNDSRISQIWNVSHDIS